MRAAWALSVLCGCSVVVHGGKLSDRPHDGRGIYLSTGSSDRPYRTLGFIQVRGHGVEVAGLVEVGDAALDGTIKGALATEAARMGGDGVLHIEFLDENPSTPAERAQSASRSIQSVFSGQAQVEQKPRYVTATGEVVKFLQ